MKTNRMKRIAALILAAVICLMAAGSALAASTATVTASSLNARAGVGTSYKVLRALPRGTELFYLGVSDLDSSDNIWYKVQFGTYETGWVSAKYCELTGNSVISYAKAEYGSSNIRNNPNLDSSTIGVMPQGSTALFLNQMSTDNRGVDWYYVNYNGTIGWVSSAYTYLYTETSNTISFMPNLPDYGSTAGTLKAAEGDSYIRSLPNLTGAELGVLKKGSSATYLKERSVDDRGVVWFKVKSGNTTGWVSSRYGMLYGNYTPTTPSASTKYVKATGGDCNVRDMPSLNGDSLGTLKKGETCTYQNVNSTDDRGVVWYKVKFKGKNGWVSSKYASLTGTGSGTSVNVGNEGDYIVATAKTNIRREPNLNGKIVDDMQKGETATFTGATSTDSRGVVWYSIRFEGASGWVSSKYTKFQ